MKDLIEALEIFMKYDPESKWPTHCEHDVMYIANVDPGEVSQEDRERLEELGFICDDEEDVESGDEWLFKSYKFGSA